MVVKSLKLNKNTEYASESPTKFAFAILLHVVCLFSFLGRKVNNLLIKNNKNWKQMRPRNASQNYLLEQETLARNCVCFDLYFVHNNNS